MFRERLFGALPLLSFFSRDTRGVDVGASNSASSAELANLKPAGKLMIILAASKSSICARFEFIWIFCGVWDVAGVVAAVNGANEAAMETGKGAGVCV